MPPCILVNELGSKDLISATRYLVCLVTEEMDFLEALVLDVAQAIGLVPTGGEDIKRYLSTDGKGEVIVGELLLQDFHEGSPDTMNL